MSRRFILAIAAMACAPPAEVLPQDMNAPSATDRADVYIIAGQSNALGWGRDEHLQGRTYAPVQNDNFPQVLFAGRTATLTWGNRTHFMGWSDLRTRNPGGNNFGVEMTLGRGLWFRTPEYRQGDTQLALVKCAVGNTTLFPRSQSDDWQSTLGARCIHWLNVALTNLGNQGYTDVQVRGLVWVQGESDVLSHPNRIVDYNDGLQDLMDDMRAQLPGASNMEVVVTGLNTTAPVWTAHATKLANAHRFNAALQDLAATEPDYHYISSVGKEMLAPDNLHYNGDGLVRLGNHARDALLP